MTRSRLVKAELFSRPSMRLVHSYLITRLQIKLEGKRSLEFVLPTELFRVPILDLV